MAISWVRFLSCASSSSVDDAFCRRVTPISPLLPPCPPPSRFATLTEVPEGHSSWGVVEIIFASTWSQTGATAPREIERLFKVRHPPRAVAGFEEYLEAVRSRAGKQDPRCAADGNEMMRFHYCPAGGVNETMRFHCCSPAGGANDETMCFRCWCPTGGGNDEMVHSHCDCPSGGGMPTLAGTGMAHESGGGWGQRRAMAVCRVIAGRLRVFDPRAVLPCFLIIYRV
ncbi:unnamed protein product [Spirodela intermedia]|uniref:Uncharacterized protein n=1 Tax=Spirodela intermedia TaxID=51605 RepID=A0A7I8LM06_SPIIN|nr:unnamed protein product [Spirodela intermedia]